MKIAAVFLTLITCTFIYCQIQVSITGDAEAQAKLLLNKDLYPRTNALKEFIKAFNKYDHTLTVLIENNFTPDAKIYFPVISEEENNSLFKKNFPLRPSRPKEEFKKIFSYISSGIGNYQRIIPRGEIFENDASPIVAVSITLITKVTFRVKVDGYLFVEYTPDMKIKQFIFYHAYDYWMDQYKYQCLPGSRSPQTSDAAYYERVMRLLNQWVQKHDVDRYNIYREEGYKFPTFSEEIELRKPQYVLDRMFPVTESAKKMMKGWETFTEDVIISIPANIPANAGKGYADARKEYSKVISWATSISVFIDEEMVIIDDSSRSCAAGLIYNLELKNGRSVTFRAILFFVMGGGDRFNNFHLAFDQKKLLSDVMGLPSGPQVVSSNK
jgi:hypothetical protein